MSSMTTDASISARYQAGFRNWPKENAPDPPGKLVGLKDAQSSPLFPFKLSHPSGQSAEP